MLKRTLIAVTLSALFTVGVQAKPQAPHDGPKVQMLQQLRKLDLTQAQKEDVRLLMKDFRQEAKARKADKPHGGKMHPAPSPDRLVATEVDAQAMADKLAAGMEKRRPMRLRVAQLENQLYNLLTPEQQSALSEMRREHHRDIAKKDKKKDRDPLSRFELTEEQNAQMTALKEQRKELKKRAMVSEKGFRKQEKSLIKQPQLDEAQWLALVKQHEQQMVENFVAMAQLRASMMAVLTEAQRQELADDLETFGPQRKHRG
ncbi:hypothetical protein DXV75_06785 [Alteromonas aestuariivivens]|uniref:Periplasmic heavy metal sensor n=1 Tax=Alteromonas aestuariivivens TaxID=1938339 RepID=A0A3D8M9J1_9ALTE|nr:Spy/CpxP family protein refolding chaperone [Alteromonas aestuariivivens]RDV26687.1 hypothetical protein DXV75_06785 [Alteromonas aestuariivivens]